MKSDYMKHWTFCALVLFCILMFVRWLTPSLENRHTAQEVQAAELRGHGTGWNDKRDIDADIADEVARDAMAAGDERGRKTAAMIRARIKPKAQ